MLDLIVRGDRVVLQQGVAACDLGIQGGKIVVITAPGALQEAGRVIDAMGMVVIPGGIDPHLHCLWPLPDPTGGPAGLSEGPEKVSRAALYGGTTTVVDFARWLPGETVQRSIEIRDADWKEHCHCDYAFHVMFRGDIPPEVLDQIPETIQSGYPSMKIFTCDVTPQRRGRKIAFGDLLEILKYTKRHGGIVAVHGEDDEIVMHMYEKLIREGRTSFENIPDVHTALAEELAFHRVIRLAENLEGAALYMLHVSAERALRTVAESRSRGYPVYAETLHQYALYTREAYLRQDGQIYHTYPSLKEESDCEALWDGLADGTISTVASDEMCSSLAIKIRGRRIDDITGGTVGVEPRIGVIYTEAVVRRGFSLEKFAEITSTNAAKILGLFPRKGVIAVGSDADIAVIDPTIKRTLRKEDLHESDYSPWEGWKIQGWPTMTIAGGRVVVENGTIDSTRMGRWVEGKVGGSVLARPAF